MVRRYHGFVRLKASSYFLIGGDSDDLIQEGLVGLYKAIRDYRSDRESSFRNFAELCITRQIITAVKTATRNKHTPLNSYVSFSQTPAAGGEEGEPTMADVLPGLDRARPGQPGDLDRGDPEPGLVHHERPERAREPACCRSTWTAAPTRRSAERLECDTKTVDNALQRVKRKVGTAPGLAGGAGLTAETRRLNPLGAAGVGRRRALRCAR